MKCPSLNLICILLTTLTTSAALRYEESQLNLEAEHVFLTALYDLLSNYNFQKNLSNYDVKDLKDWGKNTTESERGIEISDANYEDFLNILSSYDVVFENPKILKSKSDFVRKINEILAITLKRKPRVECCFKKDSLVIKSNFITTTEIEYLLKSSGNFAKQIIVYASDTIFVDSNLDLRSYKSLSLLSPHWSVQKQSEINLNGLDGKNSSSRAEDCKNANEKGKNGKPGLPGQSGGSFFGLAKFITDSHLLTVKSFGGRGGSGQQGGRGGPFGKGGHGGIGGSGGFPGQIKMIDLCKKCEKIKIDFQISIGWNGDRGLGGEGGDFKGVKGLSGHNKDGALEAEKAFSFTPEFTKDLIGDFKMFLLSDLGNDVVRQKILRFFQDLTKDHNIQIMYSISDIFHEFQALEKQFYKIKDRSLGLPEFYKTLLVVAEQQLKNSSGESLKMLTALLTALLSKISSMEEASSSFIINLREYSDLVIEKIKDLETIGDRSIIEKNRDDLRKEIDQKITDIHDLIDLHISPKLKHLISKFDSEIDDLIEEIQALEAKAEDNLELLKKQKQKLEVFTVLKSIFSTINIFISAIPGLPGILRIGSEAGAQVFDTLIDKQKKSPELKTLEGAKYLSSLDRYEEKTVYLSNTIGSCKKNTRKSRSIKDFYKNNKDMIKDKARDASRDVKYLKKDIQNDMGEISKISKKIEDTEDHVKNLKQFESHVCNLIKPTIGAIIKTISNLKTTLQDKSEANLLIDNWELEQRLKDVKLQIQKLFKGFIVGENISQTIDEIVDVLNTLINTFKVVEKYKEQKRLGEFISRMHSQRFLDVVVENKDNQKMLDELLLHTKSNIILMEYKLFVDAIKQFAFPLASSYFKEFAIAENVSVKNNTEECVRSAIEQIESFKYKLEKSYVSIGKFDKLRHKSSFFSADEKDVDGPFHVWKNYDNRHVLRRLLEGKEVLLTSRQKNQNQNAVKFNTIGIRFRVLDNLLQKDLDFILKSNNLLVSLTHMGNSYYRCGKKTFLISTESQCIKYSFREINDEPLIKNEVYTKIKSGDTILSPFTTWKIQLVNLSVFDFRILEEFVDFVDLELVGGGEYYNLGEGLCDGGLEEYYEVEEVDEDGFYYYKLYEDGKEFALGLVRSNGTTRVSLGLFVLLIVLVVNCFRF